MYVFMYNLPVYMLGQVGFRVDDGNVVDLGGSNITGVYL